MQNRCKSRYGWRLAFLLTLAFTQALHGRANAQAQASAHGSTERNSTPVLFVEPPSIDSTPSSAEFNLQVISSSLESTRPWSLASNKQQLSPLASPTATAIIGSRSVACQTAHAWMPAKQLRQQARAVQELHCDSDECTRQAANAIASFLNQQAAHQQDVAAAIALRAYYGHSAIEEQMKLVQQSVESLQLQRDRQAAILQKGIAAAIDLTSLDRESINIETQRLQLFYRDRQLTESLNEATHVQYDWQSSAVEPLDVRTQTLQADYLQQFALTHRHDLLALQCLNAQINSGTAPVLASVVSSAAGMISLPLPKLCFMDRLLGREDNVTLARKLKESLALAIDTQSQAIRREVSEKTIALELAYKRSELALETTNSWSQRVSQLERLAELGDNRPAELTAAEASRLGSKALQVERRLEAKLAEIALAEACGGLCYRCCQGEAWLITSR